MVPMSDEMHKELLLLKRILGKSGSQIIREGIEQQLAVNKTKINKFKAELAKGE